MHWQKHMKRARKCTLAAHKHLKGRPKQPRPGEKLVPVCVRVMLRGKPHAVGGPNPQSLHDTACLRELAPAPIRCVLPYIPFLSPLSLSLSLSLSLLLWVVYKNTPSRPRSPVYFPGAHRPWKGHRGNSRNWFIEEHIRVVWERKAAGEREKEKYDKEMKKEMRQQPSY